MNNAGGILGHAFQPLRGVAADAVKTQSGQEIKGRKFGRAGDESFWGIGIPAIFGAISHQRTGSGEAGHILPLGWWWHTPEDTLDKIDPRFLVRDTQVFTHGVLRLLIEDILPLDYRQYAQALARELNGLKVSGSTVDARALADLAGQLAEAVEAIASDLAPDADERLRALSRVLVPLECADADRFSHDPALPLSHWPALDALRVLKNADPGSDDFRHAQVGAVRSANRIRRTLRDALTILDANRAKTRKKRT